MPWQSSIIPWLENALHSNESDECILWPFSRTRDGYGHLGYQGKMVLAHRLAFYLTYSHWPTPCGLHICDNPPCFNPKHIFKGTRAQNNADAGNKGRKPFGLASHASKLTPALVRQIRKEYKPWENGYLRLANKFGVDPKTIEHAILRDTWKRVT